MGPAARVKTALPWLCVLALLAGMVVLRTRGKDRETELAALRLAHQELNRVRAENEEIKKLEVQVQELDRLRKENEELHRLRNEVRQLREERQQAVKTAQAVQSPAARPRADAPAQPQLQQQVQQLLAENQRLRAENQQFQQLQSNAQTAPANACANNLRQIDSAKQQWALENKKTATAVPAAQEIQPYLPNNELPVCPLGGVYTLNAVGLPPACSISGHGLAQQQ